MDFLHLVLLLQGVLSFFQFAFFFLDLALESIFLALIIRLLIACLRLLFVFLHQILSFSILGSPVLNSEFILLLQLPLGLAPDLVSLQEDVREHILLLLLVGLSDLFLVVVNLVFNLLFLLLSISLRVDLFALLLVIFSGLFLLLILLSLFFFFVKLLLLFSPSLQESCLNSILLLLLSTNIKLAVLVRIVHRLLEDAFGDWWFFDSLFLISHSFVVGWSTETQHFLSGR